jgi:tight adherence protein C
MENTSLIFMLVLATVSLFMFGVYLLAQAYEEKREFKKRLMGIERPIRAAGIQKEGSSFKDGFLHFVGSLGTFLQPKKEENISAMRRLFIQAGYRKQSALGIFWGLKIFLALSFFGVTLIGKIFLWEWMPSAQFTYIAIILAILGFFAPNVWIKLRISRRKEMIQRGLPDALDLMVVCVEAGTGLDAALLRTAEEMKKTNSVLAEEVRLVNLEIRAGKTRQEALRNLAWRTDLEDVSNLTTLLVQTEKFGTSIAQALRVHSDFMRTKRFQRAEELAQKLPIKLIFPLALFILPMMFLVTLGPAIFIFLKYFANQ